MLRLLTFLKARAPWAEGVVIGASVFLSGCVDHHDYYPTRHRTVTHHRDVVHDRGYYAPSYESGHGDGGHYEGSSDYED